MRTMFPQLEVLWAEADSRGLCVTDQEYESSFMLFSPTGVLEERRHEVKGMRKNKICHKSIELLDLALTAHLRGQRTTAFRILVINERQVD